MKTFILGLVAATAVAVPIAAAPGLAAADVSTNKTTRDAHGYGVANHIANFNGDHDGIGWIRSEQTGSEISGAAGVRTPTDITVDTQGEYAPISNNG